MDLKLFMRTVEIQYCIFFSLFIKVSEACKREGMRAVCSGPKTCSYTNLQKCEITPLSSDCKNPM